VEYTFTLKGYESGTPNKAYLYINGQPSKPYGWNAGSTYTISGTNINVYVNSVSIIYTDPQTAAATVQLFVGTDKLELTHGQNVEKNDESMSQTKAYFDSSASKINSITIEVAPDINTYLMDGGEYVDSMFASFKFVVGGTTPATDAMDAVTVTQDGSNKVKLTFTNKDGTEYGIDAFYWNSQDTKWYRKHDGTYDFWVFEANVSDGYEDNLINVNDMFAVSSNYNTYILKYISYHTSSTTSLRYVTLQDVSTGTKYDIYYNSDSFLRVGSEKYNVSMEDYGSTFAIAVDLDGNGTIHHDAAVNLTTTGQGAIELSDNNSIVLWEVPLYDIDEANEPAAAKINTTAAWSSNDVNFNVAGVSTTQVGTSNVYRGMTSYGTLVETDTDADTAKIWYPGKRPAYANVALGGNPVITVGGATGGTVDQAVKVTQPIAKFASEITSPSTITSDLILIGGPCANSLVATLMETTAATCLADWNAYNGGITEGLIKEFTNAFGSGKKALVVAGTNAADTRAMAAKVMQGTLAYQN
jgi:flagellar hook assembly protein FlgD